MGGSAIAPGDVAWALLHPHGGGDVVTIVWALRLPRVAIAGIVGALIGTYAGHAARLAAIARIGAYPAAFTEDVIAISLAALIVTR